MYIHEKKKERKKKKKQRSSSWMCLLPFLPHFPDWKLAFLPPFLFFNCFTCVSYIQRQRQLCLPPCVWVYKASLFFFLRRTKRKHKFQFWIHNVFFNAGGNCFLASSLVGLFYFFGPPVHPSPPESCNGAAAIAAVVSACLLPYNRSPLLFLLDMKLQRTRLSDDTDMPVVQYKKGK